jgi:hypothetical protein
MASAATGNPWERRGEIGFGAGLIESVRLFVTNPGLAYEQTLRRGDFWSPLLFGLLIGWFGAIIGQIWQLVFQSSILSMFPIEGRDQLAAFFVTTPVMLAVSMFLTPVFMTIGLFLWSAIHHLSLLLVGALNESEAGFEGTFRVNCYGYTAQLAAIVPLFGGFLVVAWYVALQTIGAARIHGTTTGRALLGALLPLAVCCVCLGAIVVLAWAMIAAAFTQG